MTQEDKELLLKDLCARLPYHLKGKSTDGKLYEATVIYDTGTILASEVDGVNTNICCGFKPYLRPMSSMSEEEYGIFLNTQSWECGARSHPKYEYTYKTFDWLNEHHFDHRGLIEKGLALEAPEGMYDFNN